MDGLRAISILMLLVGHYFSRGDHPPLLPLNFSIGVRIFFVISGYLITAILLREHERTGTISLRQFYLRRAFRILPAALVFMVFISIAYWHVLRWYNIAAMFLYLGNYDLTRPWMIGHLWSLGVEEQFYFLWPGVLKKWYRHRVAILLGVVALVPVFRVACYLTRIPGGGYGMFPAVADMLAFGCLLAVFGGRVPKISRYAALAMVAVVILVPLYEQTSVARTLFGLFALYPLMFFSIAGILLHVVQTPYSILNCAPVVWLGRLSYSLYLWQQPFFFDPAPRPLYRLSFGFGLACLSYYLVERPMLALRERSRVSRTLSTDSQTAISLASSSDERPSPANDAVAATSFLRV